MIMPSLLSWVIGASVVGALSIVLRHLANDAHELTRSRGRASVAANQKAQALRSTRLARSDGLRPGHQESVFAEINLEGGHPLAEQGASASETEPMVRGV
jgi:hypothetical protein